MPSGEQAWRRVAEIGLAAALLAMSVAVYWSSLSLPPAMLEPVGPAAFPRVVASILGVLAAIVLGSALLRRASAGTDTSEMESRRPGLAVLTLVLSIAYIAAMEIELLGFREATVLYLLALGAVLVGFDRRRLIPIAVIAVVLGVGAHWIFTQLFYVDLP